MLNIPVVTTKFDAVYNQMVDGKNGLVVDMNGDSVYKGIMKYIEKPFFERKHYKLFKRREKRECRRNRQIL